MLTTLAIANYRSLRQIVLPLAPLNVVSGENGSGKSNLYRALRLLAETARGGVVGALAREAISTCVLAGRSSRTGGPDSRANGRSCIRVLRASTAC